MPADEFVGWALREQATPGENHVRSFIKQYNSRQKPIAQRFYTANLLFMGTQRQDEGGGVWIPYVYCMYFPEIGIKFTSSSMRVHGEVWLAHGHHNLVCFK